MRRVGEWLETEWTLAALGDPWRRVLWAPVLIPLTLVVELVSWISHRGDDE